MNDACHPCERSSAAACPAASGDAPCPGNGICQTPVTLRQARERFAREASWHEVDTRRYRCRYFSWGQGPALLMVPGLAETADSFIPLACRLTPQFRCLSYELAGVRGDGANLRRYTHADLVADALALLDHAGAAPGYVLGSSFGSTIALGTMHARPDCILRGILVGGFARRRLVLAERCLATLAQYFPGTMRTLPWRESLLRQSHGDAFAACEPDVWQSFLHNSGSHLIRTVAGRARLLHRLDLRPLLPAIRQPILIICGDQDPLVNKSCEEELLRGLPNVVRVELARCGHFPQYTHPDLLADLVRGFLTPDGCTAKS